MTDTVFKVLDIQIIGRYNTSTDHKNYNQKVVMRMMRTGICRKMDDLGRVVVPIEIRRLLEIEPKDEIEFLLDDDMLVLRKYEHTCIFCASNRELVAYMGKNICTSCIQKMNNV